MAKKIEQSVVQLSEGELARREAGRVWVRATPLRVRFELEDLVTADGHRLRVTFACSVVARPEPAERQMLQEAFLADKTTASAGDVVRVFMPGVQGAAMRVVGTRAVVEWLDAKEELTAALRKATDAAGFAHGLEVIPPYHVDVASPSLQRANQERSARAMAEREQADRVAHLRRSAEVLKEFESIRAGSPGLTVSAPLSRVAASDQAGVVQSLIDSGAKSTAELYAVAGPCLVRVTGEDLRVEDVPVPAAVGPFRSLQEVEIDGRKRLVIGGRGGIVVVDPAGAIEYAATDVTSAMGFNRVAAWGGKLWASHSEVGLVAWDLGNQGNPAIRIGREQIGAAEGARQLQVVGDRLVFCAGAEVFFVDESLMVTSAGTGSAEAIVSLLNGPRNLLAVRASGDVDVLDRESLDVVRRERRSSRVTAAALLPFYDSPRVLLAGEDGPIVCASAEDAVVTQYMSAHRGLRALAASAGQIAGVSGDRQRVVLFEVGGRGQAREVHVGARVRHRVADVAFAG